MSTPVSDCVDLSVDMYISQWMRVLVRGCVHQPVDVYICQLQIMQLITCTCYHFVIMLNAYSRYSEDDTSLWLARRLRVTKLHTADMRSLAVHYQWFIGRR